MEDETLHFRHIMQYEFRSMRKEYLQQKTFGRFISIILPLFEWSRSDLTDCIRVILTKTIDHAPDDLPTSMKTLCLSPWRKKKKTIQKMIQTEKIHKNL